VEARRFYEAIVSRNLKLVSELEEIEAARREVVRQLGLSEEGLEAALIFQWLLRLYARRVGEPSVLGLIKKLLGGQH